MVEKKSRKKAAFIRFGFALAAIVLLNVIAERHFFRIDLTEEKRFTITDATKNTLRNLDGVVHIDVYLEGDFPSGFKRLQNAIRERLEEFRVYGGRNIRYRFIDPSHQGTDAKTRGEFYLSLVDKGIQPTNLFATEDGKKIEKLIFPGATVSYGGKETSVMLLKGNQGASPEERLNQSIEGIEYEMIAAIRKLSVTNRKKIALIKGHGELDSLSIAGLSNALLENYDLFHVNLPTKENLNDYDAIVVAKPDTVFSEQDKYKIDQFIMGGGKAMFFIDMMRVSMDSAGGDGTYAFPKMLNLEDLLFRYGVRINNNLLQDLNAGAHPVVTGFMGDQPQIRVLPWPFYPIINHFGEHPTVKNLDAVYTRFVSSIDTVKADGIKKTPLLFTSKYARALAAPVRVNLNDLRDVVPENFQNGPYPVAYLLEGAFTSLYKNRMLPAAVNKDLFREAGEESKILVIADGDFVKNEVNPQNGAPYELGYDLYMQVAFANKDLLMNTMSYFLDDAGIIAARSKEIKIRPLDKLKLQNEKLKWQLINLVLPIVAIILYGLGRYYYRKQKYTRY